MIDNAGFWLFVAVILAARNVWLSVRANRLLAERNRLRRQAADLCDRVAAQAELLARRAER